jgi:hypothetical protein
VRARTPPPRARQAPPVIAARDHSTCHAQRDQGRTEGRVDRTEGCLGRSGGTKRVSESPPRAIRLGMARQQGRTVLAGGEGGRAFLTHFRFSFVQCASAAKPRRGTRQGHRGACAPCGSTIELVELHTATDDRGTCEPPVAVGMMSLAPVKGGGARDASARVPAGEPDLPIHVERRSPWNRPGPVRDGQRIASGSRKERGRS